MVVPLFTRAARYGIEVRIDLRNQLTLSYSRRELDHH